VLEPDDLRHGTKNGYGNLGCRCEPCREANTIDMREARKRWRQIDVSHNRYKRLRNERPNKMRAYKFVDPAYKSNDWHSHIKHYPKMGGPWLLFLAILRGKSYG
jgi:hypothetical protein